MIWIAVMWNLKFKSFSFLILNIHFLRDDNLSILPLLHTQMILVECENVPDRTSENFLDMKYSGTGTVSQGNLRDKAIGQKIWDVKL